MLKHYQVPEWCHGWSRVCGCAPRLWVLEHDAEAASRGVFDDLFGLVVEVVVPQAVRRERSQGGERWVYGRIHSSDRRTWTWPRSTRRTIEGSISRG